VIDIEPMSAVLWSVGWRVFKSRPGTRTPRRHRVSPVSSKTLNKVQKAVDTISRSHCFLEDFELEAGFGNGLLSSKSESVIFVMTHYDDRMESRD
jgi:hypothetical protein